MTFKWCCFQKFDWLSGNLEIDWGHSLTYWVNLREIQSFLSQRTQQVLLDGSCSSQADVISGVPQGTALGPLLFLASINDQPDADKHSDPRLFADDCLLYRLVKIGDDARKLQEDLDALDEWESKWQMKLHREKCQVIRINLNICFERPPIYRLYWHTLEVVDSDKYLGVHLTNDLTWHKHVDATVAKASRTLGFLRWNLSECTMQVKSAAYRSLVRPTHKYSSSVWDPSSSEDIIKLEKVQRQAARFVHKNDYDAFQQLSLI